MQRFCNSLYLLKYSRVNLKRNFWVVVSKRGVVISCCTMRETRTPLFG